MELRIRQRRWGRRLLLLPLLLLLLLLLLLQFEVAAVRKETRGRV